MVGKEPNLLTACLEVRGSEGRDRLLYASVTLVANGGNGDLHSSAVALLGPGTETDSLQEGLSLSVLLLLTEVEGKVIDAETKLTSKKCETEHNKKYNKQ